MADLRFELLGMISWTRISCRLMTSSNKYLGALVRKRGSSRERVARGPYLASETESGPSNIRTVTTAAGEKRGSCGSYAMKTRAKDQRSSGMEKRDTKLTRLMLHVYTARLQLWKPNSRQERILECLGDASSSGLWCVRRKPRP